MMLFFSSVRYVNGLNGSSITTIGVIHSSSLLPQHTPEAANAIARTKTVLLGDPQATNFDQIYTVV